MFSEKKIPDGVPEISVKKETVLIDMLVDQKFTKSKTEARRLFEQSAVEFDEIVVKDTTFVLDHKGILRVGKKVLVQVTVYN